MQALAQRAAAGCGTVLRNAGALGLGQPPRPYGEGVQSLAFGEVLPFLRWGQLVELSSAFARRGVSEPAFGSLLATEITARLEGHGTESANETSKLRQEQASAWEVVAVALAFSKMTPEVPTEIYSGLFSAIADGIRAEEWPFTCGQERMLGVAFAEASVHENLLPRLLEGPLSHITGGCGTSVTESELRYGVHAAAKLPSPGINESDAILIAQRIQEMIGSMSFGSRAHLLISWLKIRVKGEARGSYFEVLATICSHLTAEQQKCFSSHDPTWAFPSGTLALVLSEFVAAEQQYHGKALLFLPVFPQVVRALVRIQRGKNENLDLEEWVSIFQTVSDFCRADASATAQMRADGTTVLPWWAHDVFSYICGAAYRDRLRETGLEPLLQLLRLVGHHKLHKRTLRESHKFEVFLQWCALRLEKHFDACEDPRAQASILEVYFSLVREAERQSFQLRTSNSDTRLDVFTKALWTSQEKDTRATLTIDPVVQQSPVCSAFGLSAGMAPPTRYVPHTAKANFFNGSCSTANVSCRAAGPQRQRVWSMLGAGGPVME